MEYTPEKLNYFRVCYITFKLIPRGLRRIFKQEWDFRYKGAFGEWKDTPKNGRELYSLESPESRQRFASPLKIIQNGNTTEWDISCLLFAILFSNSIGATLSPAIKRRVDDLRTLRNEIVHLLEASLTDFEFQNYADRVLDAFSWLGLSVDDIRSVTYQRSFPTPEVKSIEDLGDVTDKPKAQVAPAGTVIPIETKEPSEHWDWSRKKT